jgi:hypothetical protein
MVKGAQPCFFETFTLMPFFSNARIKSTWFSSAAVFNDYEHFLIAITRQVRCFRNSQKTSIWSLSAAASSAVKSLFFCNMYITAITEQVSWHLQVAILCCYSHRYSTVITCNISIEAMVQQQSR